MSIYFLLATKIHYKIWLVLKYLLVLVKIGWVASENDSSIYKLPDVSSSLLSLSSLSSGSFDIRLASKPVIYFCAA